MSHSASRKAEGKATATTDLPPEYLTSPLSQQSQVPAPALAVCLSPGNPPHAACRPQLPPKRDETALQEEEELQLALALSQSEAEEKERLVSSGDWLQGGTQVMLEMLQETDAGGPELYSGSTLPVPPGP